MPVGRFRHERLVADRLRPLEDTGRDGLTRVVGRPDVVGPHPRQLLAQLRYLGGVFGRRGLDPGRQTLHIATRSRRLEPLETRHRTFDGLGVCIGQDRDECGQLDETGVETRHPAGRAARRIGYAARAWRRRRPRIALARSRRVRPGASRRAARYLQRRTGRWSQRPRAPPRAVVSPTPHRSRSPPPDIAPRRQERLPHRRPGHPASTAAKPRPPKIRGLREGPRSRTASS